MTTVHAELVGDKALLSRLDLDRLLEIARRSEEVTVETVEDEIPVEGIMRLAMDGHAFDWLADEEGLYSLEDLTARYH